MKTNKNSEPKKQTDLPPVSDGDCHCEWLENENRDVQQCTGCQSEIRINQDIPIHWRGSHWLLKCAFEKA